MFLEQLMLILREKKIFFHHRFETVSSGKLCVMIMYQSSTCSIEKILFVIVWKKIQTYHFQLLEQKQD